MKHGYHFKKQANADGRFLLHDEDGIIQTATGVENQPLNMFKGARDKLPCMSDVECERFLGIPAGQKRTVCVTPICGVCNSGMFWPLPKSIGEDRESEKLMFPSWVC